jgi:hypothetical protein
LESQHCRALETQDCHVFQGDSIHEVLEGERSTRSPVDFWYFLISQKPVVQGLKRRSNSTPPAAQSLYWQPCVFGTSGVFPAGALQTGLNSAHYVQ